MSQRKGGGNNNNNNKASSNNEDDELSKVPLQAILLADSFAVKFRPITLERPKVLLPLVGVPMIEYSLAWLESAGVEEVFVFCCAHSKQVIQYLKNSQWFKHPNITITTIESHNSVSAGDALRVIYERNVIHGDFVLINGDTVCNMSLAEALQEHKDRRKKDTNAVMTMVIKKSKLSPITRQSRLGTDELFMAIDPDTKQLLYYEDQGEFVKGTITLDNSYLIESSSVSLHNDMQDCYVDICAPEVLSLFTDNFDYQHLRRHFVKALLVDDIMGYKIYTHQIHVNYAAKVENFRSYDAISKDIMQRWTYPLVPDVQSFGNSMIRLGRQGTYRASDIGQSSNAEIGPFTLIGKGSTIENNSKISNSIIGEGCKIGANASIEGSYIWNNVTIEDGCKLKHAIVCDGVVIKAKAVLEPGVILSLKVVIGENFVVPAYSKVSLYEQPTIQDSDDELETADSSDTFPVGGSTWMSDGELIAKAGEASEVGTGGVGYIWSASEGRREEKWRHSVAPIPDDKLAEILQAAEYDLDPLSSSGFLPPSGELVAGSHDSDVHDSEEPMDDYFEREVEATFQRAVHENIKEENVILEVNSLRLSYNMAAADCAGAIFYSVMKLAAETPYNSIGELYNNVDKAMTTWKKLLMYYLPSLDEQIEVILKYEEMCLESVKAFSPLFSQVLQYLYQNDIIEEDAILSWESEKLGADESDKILLYQARSFIDWLKTASEEESDEEE